MGGKKRGSAVTRRARGVKRGGKKGAVHQPASYPASDHHVSDHHGSDHHGSDHRSDHLKSTLIPLSDAGGMQGCTDIVMTPFGSKPQCLV